MIFATRTWHRVIVTVMTATLGIATPFPAPAQESVNKDLDACIHKEQIKASVIGAVAGALAGLIKAKVSNDNNKDAAKSAVVGAAVGGTAGYAVAYYTAVNRCYRQNPSWVPESKIDRGSNYAQAKASTGYKPEMGVVAQTVDVTAPGSVKPGDKLDLTSRFVALTPDGSEADVIIERKLFAVADGTETEVPFAGRAREQRKVAAGESIDEAHVTIPKDMPLGAVFRYQFSVSAGGKPESAISRKTTVS